MIAHVVAGVLGALVGWLPWQVSAVFGGLAGLLFLVSLRMIDWGEQGAPMWTSLPTLAVAFACAAGLTWFLTRRIG